MKVSVVTVAYNSEGTIRQTIESFLRQHHPKKELLIVDGCSTDETVTIARSFGSPAIRIVSEKDDGLYDAMNKGLRLFSGDAVGFLNSDDTFHSNRSLELIAEGLQDGDVVFGDLYMVTDHETKRTLRSWKTGSFSRTAFRLGWAPPHATFYVRRDVAERVGAFDLRYRIASDYDYMLRTLMMPDLRVRYLPHVLVDYRLGGLSSGSLGNVVKGNLECLDSRQRHLQSAWVDPALFLRPVRRLLQARWFKAKPADG
jgi:glycosyltransferase